MKTHQSSTKPNIMTYDIHHAHLSIHGILHERASIARGKFVSKCGRICGIHETQGVEAIKTQGFPQ